MEKNAERQPRESAERTFMWNLSLVSCNMFASM